MKNKIILIVTIIVALLVGVIFVIFYKDANKNFKEVKVTKYENKTAGKTMYNNMFTVLSKEWYSEKDLNKKFGYKKSDEIKYEEKCLIFETVVENTTKNEIKFPLYEIYVETKGFANGINQELFIKCNNEMGMNMTLKPGEKINVKIPYVMNTFHFTSKEWMALKDRKFELVEYSYPEKYVWE